MNWEEMHVITHFVKKQSRKIEDYNEKKNDEIVNIKIEETKFSS